MPKQGESQLITSARRSQRLAGRPILYYYYKNSIESKEDLSHFI